MMEGELPSRRAAAACRHRRCLPTRLPHGVAATVGLGSCRLRPALHKPSLHSLLSLALHATLPPVCAIDPLLVLEPERLRHATAADGTEPFATVSVPFRLLAQLHQGHLELAEHDDPGNHWQVPRGGLVLRHCTHAAPAAPRPPIRYFGRRGEFPFQYRFAGRHRVESGFTSLVLAHELHALQHAPPERANRKQAAGEERSWLAFLQHVRGSSGEGLW